jgi:RNA polymerase sigma-70 factor (TIGR02960 family)
LVHDADDVVQESLLRAWRSIAGFDGRRSVRPWPYRIATNRCLTAIASRRRRELPTDLSPGTVPTREPAWWLEPCPDARLGLDALRPEARVVARERVELAFVAALQQLSALQRAVLVLRAALGFSAGEVAGLLETTVASVNSALQRARAVVGERTPSRSQRQELAGLGAQVRWIAARYADAWESSDVEGIVAMLAQDVRLAMPTLGWYQGPDAVRAVLACGPITHRWRLPPTWANGQLAFGCYRWHEERRVLVGETWTSSPCARAGSWRSPRAWSPISGRTGCRGRSPADAMSSPMSSPMSSRRPPGCTGDRPGRMPMLLQDKTAVVYDAGGWWRRDRPRVRPRVRPPGRDGAPGRAHGHHPSGGADDIATAGGRVHVAVVDALDQAEVDAHAAAVVERSGTLDIMVNVIGDQDVQGTPMVEMSVEDYLRPAEVGNAAAFAASQLACTVTGTINLTAGAMLD